MRLAEEVVEPPAKIVKEIGDAVMLVAPEPAQLVESTLRLVEGSAGEDGFPAIRAGIAFGPVVNRWGDWYGSTVNVASRLTTRAPARVGADDRGRARSGERRLRVVVRGRQTAERPLGGAADVPRQGRVLGDA